MIATVIALFVSIIVNCNGFKIYNDHHVKTYTDHKLIRTAFIAAERKTRDLRCNLYLHGFEQHLLDHGLLSASVDILQQARRKFNILAFVY